MKLTNAQIRQIIKEELGNVMNEMGGVPQEDPAQIAHDTLDANQAVGTNVGELLAAGLSVEVIKDLMASDEFRLQDNGSAEDPESIVNYVAAHQR
jgi:hypothetical protein